MAGPASLRARRLGIDAQHEAIVYLNGHSDVCRSEGFQAMGRVILRAGDAKCVASIHIVHDGLVEPDQAGLSEAAWGKLGAQEGDRVYIRHLPPVASMKAVRAKIWGHKLDAQAYDAIVHDVVSGRLAPVQVAAFLAASAGDTMDVDENVALTQAMVDAGERLSWGRPKIVDKHSVGGLPGNRTTPIVVAIVAAAGLTMPKTSSKAITSPAGTADTLAAVTRPDLSLDEIRSVVDQEGGCMAWGGGVRLSPADDLMIRVERLLDLDSTAQMVASILSKKIAAGSTHVVLDVPVGPTAKVRDEAAARALRQRLEQVGTRLGLKVRVLLTDGEQPVGHGIGPALEARDVLAVLRRDAKAPSDLADRSVALAAAILELADHVPDGQGQLEARAILEDGRAYRKFEAICRAQGRFEEPAVAQHRYDVPTTVGGTVEEIHNRRLAQVAKLAGAPDDMVAGVDLHVRLGDTVEASDPLFTVHAASPGELAYALDYVAQEQQIIRVRPD